MEEAGWKKDEASQWLGEIAGIRSQIDELDQLISRLLAQRLSLARQLTQAKNTLGLPVKDCSREADVLKGVSSSLTDAELAQAVTAVYETILAQSRSLQQGCHTGKADQALAKTATANRDSSRNPLYFPRVLIVGLGLIGGAIARQIKRTIPHTVVVGVDDERILAEALGAGIIDAGDTDVLNALAKSHLIVLAATPEANLSLLEKIAPHLHRRQLVVDLTSTKSRICHRAEQLDLGGADFIGGHPFFGSEKSGLANSSELDPEDKVFCLVPTAGSSEISLRRLSRWLTMLKFKVEITDATTHDIASAQLSHLVQLLAITLGAEIAEGISDKELKKILKLSGPSFAQTARLMASPAKLWIEILAQNQSALDTALTSFTRRLERLHKAIKKGDTRTIRKTFQSAATIHAVTSNLAP